MAALHNGKRDNLGRRGLRHWWAMVRRSLRESTNTPRLASTEAVLSGYPHLEEAYRVGELSSRNLMSPSRKFPSRSR